MAAEQEAKMSKVCVFLADGVEEIEALTVVDILRRGGVAVETVSISDSKSVTSSHKVTVQADKLLSEIDFAEVAMIVLPGGMPGTLNLEACKPLMEQVDKFNAEGKYLSAVCAAPSIFGHKGFLKGRTACCFPEFESHLEGAIVTKNPVEVCDHFITSRGMGTAIEFALAILARMQDQACADDIAERIVYER